MPSGGAPGGDDEPWIVGWNAVDLDATVDGGAD